MLRRFVAASSVASVAIAAGALVLFAAPGLSIHTFYLLLFVWCIAPCVWGLWLMIAPAAVVPDNLPAWGAVLGLIAAFLAAFVLDMPARVIGTELPIIVRAIAVLVMVAFYFLLWMVVRMVYRRLAV